MLTSFHIQNYRLFKDLNIPKLSQVNLIGVLKSFGILFRARERYIFINRLIICAFVAMICFAVQSLPFRVL